jgi:hypothetical protein
MKTLAARRTRNLIIVIGLTLVLIVISKLTTTALRDTARLSGGLLLGLIVFLAAYNLRKKFSFLPLGSSATWLQFHIYTGLLTAVIFGTHIQWRISTGPFEIVLAGLYGLVFGSGVVGLFLSRSFARRLTTRGDEVMFERIPVHRRRLQSDAETLVLDFLAESESSAVAQFYADRLEPFFARTRNFWQHLAQSRRPRVALLNEISSYERFLNQNERDAMRRLAGHVERKDDLDYQFALQATLKYWLFGHIPLTYALLVFAFFHWLLVVAFSGGGQ